MAAPCGAGAQRGADLLGKSEQQRGKAEQQRNQDVEQALRRRQQQGGAGAGAEHRCKHSPMKARLNGGNCERSDSAASMVAGMIATRLATAAACGGTPAMIIAG